VIPALHAVPNIVPQATAIPSFGGQSGGQQPGQQDQGGGLVGAASRFIKPYVSGSSSTVPGSAATGGWSTTTTLPGMFGFADGGAANPHNPNGSVMDKMLHAAHALKEFKSGGAALPRYDDGGAVDPDGAREASRGRALSLLPYTATQEAVPAIVDGGTIRSYGMAGTPYEAQPAPAPMAVPSYVGATSRPAAEPPSVGRNIMDHGLVSGLLRSAGYAPTEQPQAHPLASRRSDFDDRMKRWSNLFLSQGVNPQAAQVQLAVEAERRGQTHDNAGNAIQQGQLTGVLNTPNGPVQTLASKQYDLAAAANPAQIRQMNAAAASAEVTADKPYQMQLQTIAGMKKELADIDQAEAFGVYAKDPVQNAQIAGEMRKRAQSRYDNAAATAVSVPRTGPVPTAPSAPVKPAVPVPPAGAPPNARQAQDGNWYVPDPSRPGKYMMWSH